MGLLKNEPRYSCQGLNRKTVIGFMACSIGAVGAITVLTPVAGIAVSRTSAGVYDFTLPTAPAGIFVIPYALQSTTVVGFQGGTLGAQVTCLKETAGTIAEGDPGNGDILCFIIFGLLGDAE